MDVGAGTLVTSGMVRTLLGSPCISLVSPRCRFRLVRTSGSSGGFMSYTVTTKTSCLISGSTRFGILDAVSFPGLSIVSLTSFSSLLRKHGLCGADSSSSLVMGRRVIRCSSSGGKVW